MAMCMATCLQNLFRTFSDAGSPAFTLSKNCLPFMSGSVLNPVMRRLRSISPVVLHIMPAVVPGSSQSALLRRRKLYSPAVKCMPFRISPLIIRPPPTPVPIIYTLALRHPLRAPLFSSASAAHFPSLAMCTGHPALFDRGSATFCPLLYCSAPPPRQTPFTLSMKPGRLIAIPSTSSL